MRNYQTIADKAYKPTASTMVQQKKITDTPVIHDGYKRTFDLTLVFLFYFLLFPLWAALWIVLSLAIWLEDRGPVFYIQERLGQNGKRYKIIKLRTMIKDAEALTGPVWASERDVRVTKIGKLLRRFHLDEIPQVINIVRGEMSLVGPRPERPVLTEQFCDRIPGFSRRLLVKPGIAGLAQLRGNYSMSPGDKLRYDNLYISRMSPWLDFKLLVLSTIIVLKSGWKGPQSSYK